DRLPAEQMLHAFEQRADRAAAVIGHRPVALDRERKFLVLGADAELRLRLAAGCEPRNEFVARLDRRQIDLVTSHGKPRSKGRDHTRAVCTGAMWERDGAIAIQGMRTLTRP